jgi:hypothetical protein
MKPIARHMRLTHFEAILLLFGTACIAVSLVLAAKSVNLAAEPLAAPSCDDWNGADCATIGRSLAEADMAVDMPRYFLVGLVRDDLSARVALASVGVRLVLTGYLCCDPLRDAYNRTVLAHVRDRHPKFEFFELAQR